MNWIDRRTDEVMEIKFQVVSFVHKHFKRVIQYILRKNFIISQISTPDITGCDGTVG